MILKTDYFIKNKSIICFFIFVLILILITGCFEEQIKPYSILPNGTRIYGDHDKIEINNLSIRTQAGRDNTTTITYGHWFTPENLPNITDDGEYIWAIYNITGQIKNIAGYNVNINFSIKFYNNSDVFLFSDILHISKINDNSISDFNFIVNYEQKYFNEIDHIEFNVSIE
jgi:hypothetical protein